MLLILCEYLHLGYCMRAKGIVKDWKALIGLAALTL